MILSGVIVNSVAVGFGSLLGVFFRNKFNKKVIDTVMSGMGLCVLYIGISGSLKGQNILVTIGSIALGITKIKAANLSLAPFIPIFIYLFI